MKKQKYVIASYRTSYGGVIVLHNLCRLLNELGQNASIIYFADLNYSEKHKVKFWVKWIFYSIKITVKAIIERILGPDRFKGFFNVSMKGVKRKYTPFVSKDTIVVYSELMFGNPLKAKKVVRWLLYHNKHYKLNGDKTIGYDKNDLFFSYREVFNDWVLNPECRICYTPYMDLKKYKRYNYGERHGKCYILRKGEWRVNKDDCKDGIIVDDLPEKEKTRVFNECEYCISYDTQTAYSQIAAMCGCISIVVPEKDKGRKDYRQNESSFGEAFGFDKDEIEYSLSTAPLLKDFFHKSNEKSKEQVINFIRECKDYFLIL